MIEALLIIYVFLFIFSICIMFLYYKRIREGLKEHAKAKVALDDIIVSFNSDLQRQEEKFKDIANRSEKSSAESLQAINETNSEILTIKMQLEDLTKIKGTLLSDYDVLRKTVDNLVSQRDEILNRMSKLESLEGETDISPINIESVIPIRKEKALATLTETEMRILKMLANKGGKTAPEIKDEIGLTREHTSRLMKKLYAHGYIERGTDKMPYVYRLKKEMGDLLKSQNTEV